MIDYAIDYATIYANKIVNGEIIACQKVKQACKRHLRDLERSKDPDFSYEYRIDKANKPIKFMEMLPDVSTGKKMQLALFQKFIVGSLYGWVDKINGYRRYNKAYISMARKNGKSVLIAGIALYELIYGEYPQFDRQIYATANSKDQAGQVFKMVAAQLKKIRSISPAIRKLTKVVRNEIRYDEANSILKPLSRDTDNLDGLNVLLGILDEYHTSNDTSMMEVLESSQSQQKQPLIIIISTAGFKLNAPMYTQEYPYITKILTGEEVNENYFAICYEQEDETEINDETLWIKSNPILEADELKEIMLKNLRKKLAEARAKDELHGTLVKNFNMWQSASTESFLNGNEWKVCNVENVPNLYGRDVYIGVDLSRTNDLSAITWIVPIKDKFFIDSHSFVGTKGGLDTKIKRDKIDYRQLAQQGYCTITTKESGIIDYQDIIDFINQLVEKYNFTVKGIMYDPYTSPPFITELEEKYPLIEVRQGAKTLSPATRDFQLKVYDKQVIHNNNPLLTIAVNNAVLKKVNDTVQINKEIARNKIDPIAAGINAWTQAMFHQEDTVDWNSFYHDPNNISF